MRFIKILFVLVGLSVLGASALAYRAYRMAQEPYKGYAEPEVFVTLPKGASGARIGAVLEEEGVIRDRRLFLAALRFHGHMAKLQAGEYRFAEPLSTYEVLDRLVAGDIYTFAVTIPEGLTLEETASHLAARGLGDASELELAFESPEWIAELDPAAENLEGYLYPTTYRFTRNPKPSEIARTLAEQFKAVFGTERRARAEAVGLSPRKVVTFASIIEKETASAEERPLIGSVFWNRLARSMPLGSDPTIIFALKLEGRFDGNLRRADLEMDSPYNTYRYAGLPPGPIASPGAASIDAVLHPAESDFLFFVSKNDGTHHFSRTYREHVNAVRKYQVEYFRKRRQRGAGPS